MTRGTLLTIAAGLLVLTYLLFESRGPDPAGQARVHAVLQAIQLHDAELNREVLLARAGLLPHYDSLPRISRKLAVDLDMLRASVAPLHQPAFDQDITRLTTTLTDKLRTIEYVKSDTAVLRNSVAYFGQLDRSAAARRQQRRSAIDMEAATLSHAVMRYVAAPAAEVTTEAEAALARVVRLSQQQRDLVPIAAHGRLVIDLVPRLDALLQEIGAAPVAAATDALQRAMLQSAGRMEARAQRFRVVMYLAALLLLGYVVYQVARLRARTRELRRQEMQLIQANKMTSLGLLVSGVAHEVNNPNQLVLMNSSVLASVWDDAAKILDAYRGERHDFEVAGLTYEEMRETVPPLIRQMGDGARRIERIIADLKDFARPGVRAPEQFHLNEVVDHATRLLKHLIQQRTDRFQVELAPDVPPLHGDRQQVEQVVVNLVVNALEALRNRSGAVTITTSFDAAAPAVVFEVQDDGVGIAGESLSRLGEPFFTTKAASGGTGLGLAIASSLVRLHHGRLRFVSEPGRGTRAIVELPPARDVTRPESAVLHGSLS